MTRGGKEVVGRRVLLSLKLTGKIFGVKFRILIP